MKDSEKVFYKLLGSTIQNIRKKKGLTQSDVGILLDKNRTTITHYENGIKQISIFTLCRLAHILDIDVGLFLKNFGFKNIDSLEHYFRQREIWELEERLYLLKSDRNIKYQSRTKYGKLTKESIASRPEWKQNTIKPKEED